MNLLISVTHQVISLPLSLSLINDITIHPVALVKNLRIYDFFLIPYM